VRRILTLPKFVKELGFTRANKKDFREHFDYLLKIGAIELQQGGFLGDSIHHPKLVVIRDIMVLQAHFQKTFNIVQQELEIEMISGPHLERRVTADEYAREEKNVGYFTVGQFGKTLYIELDSETIRSNHLEKGDIVRVRLLDLRKAPRPDEPIREAKNEWKEEEE
jgi:hypothetical protein